MFYKKTLLFVCISISSLLISNETDAKRLVNRVYSQLLIENYDSALKESKEGIVNFPDDLSVRHAYIDVLVKIGDEKSLSNAWHDLLLKFPDEKDNLLLIENRAWSVITKGFSSSALNMRAVALLGAFFTQDNRGITLIDKGLSDQNYLVRNLAIQLASNLKDRHLQLKIYHLFKREKDWKLRLELISALGKMKVKDSQNDLLEILKNPNSHPEEQIAVVGSLVEILDEIDIKEVQKLATSDRLGLRKLFCELAIHTQSSEYQDLLIKLLDDNHPAIRSKALYALGMLNTNLTSDLKEKVVGLGNEQIPIVSITAGWLLAINDKNEGKVILKKWLNDAIPLNRHIAAAACALTGNHNPYLTQFYLESQDPYVKMNLVLGLVYKRFFDDETSEVLCKGLKDPGLLMWDESTHFKTLTKSTVKFNDAMANYPEVVNQLTRLEIINILAIMKSPYAKEALINFLENRKWGITGFASALMLTEGDESAIDIIIPLLKHQNHNIRVQAALVLSLWGKNQEPLQILLDTYPSADKELKEKILESLGKIGSKESLSFLIQQLDNPSQSLRILAASAIIQSLYH